MESQENEEHLESIEMGNYSIIYYEQDMIFIFSKILQEHISFILIVVYLNL